MRKFLCSLFAVPLIVVAAAPASAAHESTDTSDLRSACQADLAALPPFLETNDAGVQTSVQSSGHPLDLKHFEKYMREASSVQTDEQCDQLLREYLSSIRRGHLLLQPMTEGTSKNSTDPDRSSDVRVFALDRRIAVLKIRSFDQGVESTVGSMLARYRSLLKSHRSWLIDVRGNSGGSDSVWQVLMPHLGIKSTTSFGVEFLATPDNVEANKRLLDATSPGSKTSGFLQATVDRMQSAAPSTYIRLDERLGKAGTFTVTYDSDTFEPKEVVVLTDTGCASSCEEFLLAVRQSWRVKLFGQSSAGSLDYSNLRPHGLPSERRGIWYATSRSLRLPAFPVDGRGIAPDIAYPRPLTKEDEEQELKAAADFIRSGDVRH